LRVEILGARASGPHVFTFHRSHSVPLTTRLSSDSNFSAPFYLKRLCAGDTHPGILVPLLRIRVISGSVQPFASTIVAFVWAIRPKIFRRCIAIVMLIVGMWRGLAAVNLQSGVDDIDDERPFEVVKRERDGSRVGDVCGEDAALTNQFDMCILGKA